MSIDATVVELGTKQDGTRLIYFEDADTGRDGVLRVENPDEELHRLIGKRIWGCSSVIRCGNVVIADRYVQGIRLRPRWWKALA